MMLQKIKREAIAFWEKGRVVYQVLLVPPSLLGWQISSELSVYVDGQTPTRLTDPVVVMSVVGLWIVANLFYSLVYVLEFLFLAESPGRFWPKPGRTMILVLGCVIGMWLAGVTMSQLQIDLAGRALSVGF